MTKTYKHILKADLTLPEDQQRVFILHNPTMQERNAFYAEAMRLGMSHPTNGQFMGELERLITGKDPIETTITPDQLRLIVAEGAEPRAPDDQRGPRLIDDEDFAYALQDLEEQALARGGRYARLRAEQFKFTMGAPRLALRMFLVGWENLPKPFARKGSGICEEALAQLSESEQDALGWAALAGQQVTKADEKNLQSPSPQ